MPTCPPIRGAVTESHTHVIMSVSQRVEHWAQEGPRGACVWGQHVPGQRVCGDSTCVRGQRACGDSTCVYWDSVRVRGQRVCAGTACMWGQRACGDSVCVCWDSVCVRG